MKRKEDLTLLISGVLLSLVALGVVTLEPRFSNRSVSATDVPEEGLLTDPFLQLPTENSVRVVWFTEFEGREHIVLYGEEPDSSLEAETSQQIIATTQKLTRLREDQESNLPSEEVLESPTSRDVWRHEAEVTGLTPGQKVPYQVRSLQENGTVVTSDVFLLTASPPAGQPLKILLTSDHQSKPMTAANLQKVEETIGAIDAVFLAGDLVNVPDRASEWFDDAAGAAFFPALQGRASYQLESNEQTTLYRGGRIIQEAPLFPATGNHEVMGRFSTATPLNDQFNDPVPRSAAVELYETNPNFYNPLDDPNVRRQWIIDHSYNTETYEEIFSLPVSQVPNPDRQEETSLYYATTFGDVRLVSLFVTNIWRKPAIKPDIQGRFQERQSDLANPADWGYGQHIFEPIKRGSWQYQWLQQELASDTFQQAKYKVVMLHHPPHSLGDNVVPPFTDPVPLFDRNADGTIRAIRYEYPIQNDYIIQDLVPLLEEAGVDLVLYGHSHLWNRFVGPTGMHFLETSNVGNTYGAFWRERSRRLPPDEATKEFDKYQQKYYVPQGDPNGLEPIVPTIAPLTSDQGTPLPYIASKDITAFSILDTGSGTVSSYYFDTRQPNSEVVKFDEFQL
ncbi:metallophosphoesterase family protein [Oscillatoria sp. CS-180]|uniref:purple acid phosphatase family protein n=1 Tax=Oscillatoria sp. CS-180 TaxID=3021720 RepID=UPI00232BA92C|nr:metallophosphoesterase family protein [Oscillatoria sp. CS-180]MDB9528050.1 metallophosphoesterase family protein [Oscillatoria sp. CS-180]